MLVDVSSDVAGSVDDDEILAAIAGLRSAISITTRQVRVVCTDGAIVIVFDCNVWLVAVAI